MVNITKSLTFPYGFRVTDTSGKVETFGANDLGSALYFAQDISNGLDIEVDLLTADQLMKEGAIPTPEWSTADGIVRLMS
jgi:hypothetical protein